MSDGFSHVKDDTENAPCKQQQVQLQKRYVYKIPYLLFSSNPATPLGQRCSTLLPDGVAGQQR
jgi:hypothetical protein